MCTVIWCFLHSFRSYFCSYTVLGDNDFFFEGRDEVLKSKAKLKKEKFLLHALRIMLLDKIRLFFWSLQKEDVKRNLNCKTCLLIMCVWPRHKNCIKFWLLFTLFIIIFIYRYFCIFFFLYKTDSIFVVVVSVNLRFLI